MAPLREHPRRRRGAVWAWVAGLLVGAMLVGFVGWYGRALWAYANHDVPELIDDPAVVSVIERSCTTMTSAVNATTPALGDPPTLQAAAVVAQDAAVARMVAEVRGVGQDTLADDRPAEDWLADWERLTAARERSAAMLAQGKPPRFAVPAVDNRPITTRMDELGVCPVPPVLTRVGPG